MLEFAAFDVRQQVNPAEPTPTRLKDKHLVYLRSRQGSDHASLLWAGKPVPAKYQIELTGAEDDISRRFAATRTTAQGRKTAMQDAVVCCISCCKAFYLNVSEDLEANFHVQCCDRIPKHIPAARFCNATEISYHHNNHLQTFAGDHHEGEGC